MAYLELIALEGLVTRVETKVTENSTVNYSTLLIKQDEFSFDPILSVYIDTTGKYLIRKNLLKIITATLYTWNFYVEIKGLTDENAVLQDGTYALLRRTLKADWKPSIELSGVKKSVSYAESTESTLTITIGLNQNQCYNVASSSSDKFVKFPFLTQENDLQTKTDIDKARIISCYINIFLSSLSPIMFKRTSRELFKLSQNKSAGIKIRFEKVNELDIDIKFAITYGFAAITSIAKFGSEVAHYKDWFEKRVKSMCMSCKMRGYTTQEIKAVYNDLKYLGEILDGELLLRQALYHSVLGLAKPSDLNAQQNGFISHVHMVLEWTGLNSFRMAYDFAIETATAAHTHEVVVRESEAIIEEMNKLMELPSNKIYSYKFDYILEGSRQELTLRHYPHLVFCVKYIGEKKKESMKNYKINDNADLQISAEMLKQACDQSLEITQQEVSARCVAYIKKHGKKVPQAAVSRGLDIESIAQIVEYLKSRETGQTTES